MNVLEEDVNKGPASSTGKNLEEKRRVGVRYRERRSVIMTGNE